MIVLHGQRVFYHTDRFWRITVHLRLNSKLLPCYFSDDFRKEAYTFASKIIWGIPTRGVDTPSWFRYIQMGDLVNCPCLSVLGLEWASWWRHQTFSALLAFCARNSPVNGEFPAQRPVTRSFDVFFDLRLHKWLSKQSWGWWFETLPRPLRRHCNG